MIEVGMRVWWEGGARAEGGHILLLPARLIRSRSGFMWRGESGARSGRGAGEEAGEDGVDVSCDAT